MAVYEVKANDTDPMEVELRDRRGVADLTGAVSITFGMKARTGPTVVTRAATVKGEPEDGTVLVSWLPGDLQTPGLYDGEVQVVQANGKKQTFPSGGDPPYLVIDVKREIVTT